VDIFTPNRPALFQWHRVKRGQGRRKGYTNRTAVKGIKKKETHVRVSFIKRNNSGVLDPRHKGKRSEKEKRGGVQSKLKSEKGEIVRSPCFFFGLTARWLARGRKRKEKTRGGRRGRRRGMGETKRGGSCMSSTAIERGPTSQNAITSSRVLKSQRPGHYDRRKSPDIGGRGGNNHR